MKRRSARPFTVEVKHTRTSRVALVDTATRSRGTPDLWWDIPPVTAEQPDEAPFAPAAPAEPRPAELPTRRVLPSLVPMFSTASEPDADEAPSRERLPQVRRGRPPGKRPQKPVAEGGEPVPAAAPVAPQPAPVAVPNQPAPVAVPSLPAAMPGRTFRLSRQADTLKAGERWKRRLPRHLW